MVKKNIEKIQILPDSKLTCFVLTSLFSKSECEELLNNEVKKSFKSASLNYPKYYRNNERLVLDNELLSQQLFNKVKDYLPEFIKTYSDKDLRPEVWSLKGINKRLRFCKYSVNQYFSRHLDGVHYHSETEQSKLTFMLYLNSSVEFKGGRTLFFRTKDSQDIWASYIPKQGDLIVFDHNIWHEGEILSDGEKYVLRSDILFSNNSIQTDNTAFKGHLGYIWSLLKFNNNYILSGGRDKAIRVWNHLGELLFSLMGHENSVLCIEKIQNDIFITGSRDKSIIVWRDFKEVNRINIHSATILSLCCIDENRFLSSSGDALIQLVNLNGEILKVFKEHSDWVWNSIKINDDLFASCSEDGSIKIWNLNSEKSLMTFNEDFPIQCLGFIKRRKTLISGNIKGEIKIRTLTDNLGQKESKCFKAHRGIVRTIKVIDDENFATGGEDGKLRIWNIQGLLKAEYLHDNFVQAIELLEKDRILSASYDGTIKVRDLSF